ncbi:unnamed protein product [Phytophthora fragariaefolia]|uniref:Unnamed protein product n=1 Tax=Phytophthora fragariaefolia TaxID=1490495 RepID=A0A9W6U6F8_9STRA|nr:unnamed protein product [Phytophthora fragariaefolia]
METNPHPSNAVVGTDILGVKNISYIAHSLHLVLGGALARQKGDSAFAFTDVLDANENDQTGAGPALIATSFEASQSVDDDEVVEASELEQEVAITELETFIVSSPTRYGDALARVLAQRDEIDLARQCLLDAAAIAACNSFGRSATPDQGSRSIPSSRSTSDDTTSVWDDLLGSDTEDDSSPENDDPTLQRLLLNCSNEFVAYLETAKSAPTSMNRLCGGLSTAITIRLLFYSHGND